jgi:peptidylprolyl isomerase
MGTITFLYRGSLADGTVFDDGGDEPHEIAVGRSQVMPALEQALLAMEVGEERSVEIPAVDAYGNYDEGAVQMVPQISIPNGENLPIGETIMWTAPKSPRPIPVKVKSIVDRVVTLDFNHPLAGQDIVYWVQLLHKTP